ncbi:hypothetical protein SprV_0301220300 [Sparganum proliferum]
MLSIAINYRRRRRPAPQVEINTNQDLQRLVAQHRRKIIVRIPLNLFNRHLRRGLLPEGQYGLWRHRGTTSVVSTFCQLQEKCQEMRTHLCTTFEELRKVFGTVNREGLWKIMQKFALRRDDGAGDGQQGNVDLVAPDCANFGLNINTDKTVLHYQPPLRAECSAPRIQVGGIELEIVDNFAYLGSTLPLHRNRRRSGSLDLQCQLGLRPTAELRMELSRSPPQHQTKDVRSDYLDDFGQTGRMLGSRIHEHKLAVRRGDALSQVAAHTYEMGHVFNFAATKTVAHAGNKTGRELIEARASDENSVNRFIDLAPAYRALRSHLQACDVGQ